MPTLINFALFQAGWFACLLLAARGWPVAASLSVVVVVAVHLCRVRRPKQEAWLITCAMLLGLVVDSLVVSQGVIRYHHGQPFAALPPHWIVALWALFATTLNVSLRWLKVPPATGVSEAGSVAASASASASAAASLSGTIHSHAGRRWLAALMGAVAAPLSYAAGVRLGAADFLDTPRALALLAVLWAVAMPLLVRLAERFDGVRAAPALAQPAA